MTVTCRLTDTFSRCSLIIYPYSVIVVSVLALGIVGYFDFTMQATRSLLVGSALIFTSGPLKLLISLSGSSSSAYDSQIVSFGSGEQSFCAYKRSINGVLFSLTIVKAHHRQSCFREGTCNRTWFCIKVLICSYSVQRYLGF
jgi:hypothetical protein